MRTFCAFVLFFSAVLLLTACQKQLSGGGLSPLFPQGDSLIVVKTLLQIDYDATGAFLYQERQNYTYDSQLNRTIVSLSDSDVYNPGTSKQFTATFQYDANKRLAQYTSTGGIEPAARIDFMYNAAGDIVKSTMQNNWIGKTFDCWYSTKQQNGQKIITVYDTSGIYNTSNFGGDNRPEILHYSFDATGRLTDFKDYYTVYRQPSNLYEDTFNITYYYDNQNFIYKSTSRDSYHAAPTDVATAVNQDSTLLTSQGNSIDLRNSFFNLYRNMYWLDISEYGSGFSNALNKNDLINYTGTPVKNADKWLFPDNDPTPTEHDQGVFQNSFDANGRLVKLVVPNNFGNKYGGRTEYFYTYTTIRN